MKQRMAYYNSLIVQLAQEQATLQEELAEEKFMSQEAEEVCCT